MQALVSQAKELREQGSEVRRFLEWLQQDERLQQDKVREDARLSTVVLELQEFARSQERLTTHQRTEPAAQLLTKWRDAEKEHQTRAEKHGVAAGEMDAAILAEAESDKARQLCAQEFEQTRERGLAVEPQIALARTAWSARGTALHQFTEANEALIRKQTAHQQANTAFQELASLLQQQHELLAVVKMTLEEFEGTDDLIPRLPVWQTRLDAWTAATEQAMRLQNEMASVETERNNAEEQLMTLRQKLELESSAQAAARLALSTAEAAAVHLTGGLTAAEFRTRREADTLRGQAQVVALDTLIQLQERSAAKSDELSGILAQSDTEDAAIQGLKDQHVQAVANVARLNAEFERLSQAREQLGLVLEIVERRSALAQDEACPLCGSMEHPYRTGTAVPPDHSHYQAERERAEAFLTVHQNDMRAAAAHEKKCDSELLLAVSSLQAKRARTQELSSENEGLQQQLRDAQGAPVLRELVPESGWTGTDLSQVRTHVSEALSEWQRQLKELQRLVDTEMEARTALAAVDLRVATSQSDVKVSEAQVTSLGATRETLLSDLNRARSQGNAVAEQLREELAQHAWLAVVDPFTIDVAREALATAETRLAQWRDMTAQYNEVDAIIRQREIGVERTRAALETSEKALAEQREALQGYQKALEDAELQVAMHLEGRSPDEVAAEWKRRVEESQQRFTQAEQVWNTARVALETARTVRDVTGTEATDALKKLGEAEVLFTEALREVGLANVAALEQARLPQDEWLLLSRRAQELDDQKKQAEGAASVVNRQLDASRLARPEAMPQDATAEALHEASTALTEAEHERTAGLAQIQAALNSNAEQGERLGNLMAQLGERQIEAERWKLIDDLIGTTEGSKFRRLAQGYHLIELADFANLRLEKLSDRYRLRVKLSSDGAPTMDFLVQDAHQADRERPLTTLSGGETFMVSLALALALSDFRAVRMPIETVLIDEGFGTLDPVTLNTVVQALENLQSASGARVGIISHVAGLSERIGGRVLVKREAAGRSRILVEAAD
jgi:exonuclease SbcC